MPYGTGLDASKPYLIFYLFCNNYYLHTVGMCIFADIYISAFENLIDIPSPVGRWCATVRNINSLQRFRKAGTSLVLPDAHAQPLSISESPGASHPRLIMFHFCLITIHGDKHSSSSPENLAEITLGRLTQVPMLPHVICVYTCKLLLHLI